MLQDMWKLVASKELRTRLKPGLVWTEISEPPAQRPPAVMAAPLAACALCLPRAPRDTHLYTHS